LKVEKKRLSSRRSRKSSTVTIIALTIIILCAVFLRNTLAQPETARTGNPFQTVGSVIGAFENDLNNHDSASALALFADTAIVSDFSNIACLPGPSPFCSGYNVFTSKTQIQGWLEQLVKINVELKDVGVYQITGNNVTWVLRVSVDEYRRLDVAPLDANANAIIQEGKISSLAVELTPESTDKLSVAYAQNRASPYGIMTGGVGLGIILVGLVFPAAAVYYISRVKRLFASVPGLNRPWVILGAGVGSIFVSVLLVALRDIAGMNASIADSIFDALLVVCCFVVMSAIVLMKRVMTSESDE